MKELIEAEPVAMCMLCVMATVVVLALIGHGLNIIRQMIKASAKGDEILFV